MYTRGQEMLSKDILEETVQDVHKILHDPIVTRLLKRSNLTKVQLETLLIHFLLETKYPGAFNYNAKGQACSKKLSRGAFYRSLTQAMQNIIESIYTVILLGYIGIFESPELQPLIDLSESIKTYVTEMNEKYNLEKEEKRIEIELIVKRIIRTIESISSKILIKRKLRVPKK